MSVNWEELNRQYYNELSKTDKWRYENVYEDEYRKLFYELIQPKPSTKILDLGCGNGFYYQWLRTISDAYALDIAEEALAQIPNRDTDKVKCGEFTQTPFPDNFFDVVFCNHVIEHTPDPIPFLKETYRILKPNGILYIATPNRHGIAEIVIDITRQYKRRLKVGHANIMIPGELKYYCEKAGFKTIKHLSQAVLHGGLPIPIIGKYLTTYCIVYILIRTNLKMAGAWIRMERHLTSNTFLKQIGYDIILLAKKQ